MHKMDYIFWLGIVAAIPTTAAFLPQVIKAHKTKHTKDLSLAMYIMFSSGVFLWIIYGLLIGSVPVAVSNVIIFTLSIYILFLKIKHG